jgi:hypothetical protein
MPTIDDQELKDLLREIEVPPGLRDRLRTIAQTDRLPRPTCEAGNKHSNWKIRVAIVAVLAAAIAGFAIKVIWPAGQDSASTSPRQVVENIRPSPEMPTRQPNSRSEKSATDLVIGELNASSQYLDEVLLSIKIRQLERKLARKDIRLVSDSNFDAAQRTSMVLVLADEAAIKLGADRVLIDQELKEVIGRFPGTLGAELADKLLKTEL